MALPIIPVASAAARAASTKATQSAATKATQSVGKTASKQSVGKTTAKQAVGNVVKTGIEQGAISRVASMVAGRADGQSKGFRGMDTTEFRGY